MAIFILWVFKTLPYISTSLPNFAIKQFPFHLIFFNFEIKFTGSESHSDFTWQLRSNKDWKELPTYIHIVCAMPLEKKIVFLREKAKTHFDFEKNSKESSIVRRWQRKLLKKLQFHSVFQLIVQTLIVIFNCFRLLN